MRGAVEHDASGFDVSGVATKADLTALELRPVKWMIGIVFAGAGLVIAGCVCSPQEPGEKMA